MNWLLFWLFLHVAGAIFAFGPALVFPIVASLAAREANYGHFAAEVNHAIAQRLVLPAASSMLVSGVGLIIASGVNLTRAPWLGAGIILYLVTMGVATGVLLPAGRKLVEATAGALPSGPATGAPDGPPPHLAALIKRLQVGGMILVGLVVVIIFLMVVKPGG